MALAVRTQVPIYVAEKVMEQAGISTEEDMERDQNEEENAAIDDTDLSVFSNFVDRLDVDDLDNDDPQN